MQQRNSKLLNARLNKYILPGIMMSLSIQLGNIIDTIFVSRFLGMEAMSAVTVSMPIETIIQFVGYSFGIGGSIAASIMLGKRDIKGASRVYSGVIVLAVMVGLVIAALAFPLSGVISNLMTGDGNLYELTHGYVLVSMLGAPVFGLALLMVNFMGIENHPELASAYLIAANVINIGLDFVFLKFTKLGTKGAALSTVLGFLLAMIIYVIYLRSPKHKLQFKIELPHKIPEMKSAAKNSVPVMVFMIATMIKGFGLNAIILGLIGDVGMAAFTICDNILLVTEMFIGGVIGIIPNMAGVLYGEKDYYGVKAICRKSLSLGVGFLVVILGIVELFAETIVMLFGAHDAQIQEMAYAIRIFVVCIIPYLWNKFMMTYYETTEKNDMASLVTLLENALLILPSVLASIIVAQNMGDDGIMGIAVAFIASEILTIIIATIFRKIRYKHSNIYILPEEYEGAWLDMSFEKDMKDAEAVPRRVKKFCEDNGVYEGKAYQAAVCAEELVVNIVKHNSAKKIYIDMNILIVDGDVQIRIRDNGDTFDPLEYEYDSDGFTIHGIELVKTLAKDVSYMRAIDMNNTVIKF